MMEARALVLATILRVKDSHFIFPYCDVCYCKVNIMTGERQRFSCMKCNRTFDMSQLRHRYRISASISDGSAVCDVSIFGKCLDVVFGTEAAHFNRLLHQHINPNYPSEIARDEMLYQTMSQCIVGKQFYLGFKLPSKKKTASSSPPHYNLKQVLSQVHPGCERADVTDGLVAYQILTPTLSVLKPSVVDLLRQAHKKKDNLNEKLRNEAQNGIPVVHETHRSFAHGKDVAHQQHPDMTRRSVSGDSHTSMVGEQSVNMTNETSDFGSSSRFSLGMTLLEVTCDVSQTGQSNTSCMIGSKINMSSDVVPSLTTSGYNSQMKKSSNSSNEQIQQDLCNKSIDVIEKSPQTKRYENDAYNTTCATIPTQIQCNCQNVCRCCSKIEKCVSSSQSNSVKATRSEHIRDANMYNSPEINSPSILSLPSTINSVSSLPSTINSVSNLPSTRNSVSNLPSTMDSVSYLPSTIDSVSNLPSIINSVSNLPSTINSVSNTCTASSFKTNSTQNTRQSNASPSYQHDLSSQDDLNSDDYEEGHVYSCPSAPNMSNVSINLLDNASLNLSDNTESTNQRNDTGTNESFIESPVRENNHTYSMKETSTVAEEEACASTAFGADLPYSEDFELFLQQMEAQYADKKDESTLDITSEDILEDSNTQSDEDCETEDKLNNSSMNIQATHRQGYCETADKTSNLSVRTLAALHKYCETEDKLKDSSTGIQDTHQGYCKTENIIKESSMRIQAACHELCETEDKWKNSITRIQGKCQRYCETGETSYNQTERMQDSHQNECETGDMSKDSSMRINVTECWLENSGVKTQLSPHHEVNQNKKDQENDPTQSIAEEIPSKSTSSHSCEDIHEDSMPFDTSSGLSYTGSQDLFSSYQEYQTAVDETFLKSHSTPLDEIDQHLIHMISNRKSSHRHSVMIQSAFGTPLLFSQDSFSAMSPFPKQSDDISQRGRNIPFAMSPFPKQSDDISHRRRSILSHLQLKSKPRTSVMRHTPLCRSTKRESRSRRYSSNSGSEKSNQDSATNRGRHNRTHSSNPDSQKSNTESASKSYLRRSISTPSLFTQEDSHLYTADRVRNMMHKTSMESYCQSFDGTMDLFSPCSQENSYHSDHLNKEDVDLRKKLFL